VSAIPEPGDTIVAVEAPAKINLYLHVTARRSDGYHVLDSLVVFAGVVDTVVAEPADEITLDSEGPFAAALGAAAGNLALKAARLLAARAGVTEGARLTLVKRLPVAAGIGGGSADAAATLNALARLWKLKLPQDELHTIAAALGADVPICLHRRPAFIGGIGEMIEDAPLLPDAGFLLVNPRIALATQSVFKNFTGPRSAAARFREAPRDAGALAAILESRRNDLTQAAVALVPEIGTVLAALARLKGARLARMSGSGSTCFALFEDLATAEAAARELAPQFPGWWVQSAPLLSADA
jgi:4-diphosphocytidyl-2-C-methyl-D-erythritol kinase